jgi:phage gpG-like protein
MANKFKLDKMANAADKAINEAIEIAANDAEQHFKKSFKDGGFTDNVLERWQPRRNQIFTGIARGKRNHPNTKPTLVGKKVLMNSIKKKRINNKKRILSSDLPYSAIHNEGLMGRAWGKYSFKMPKRKYMGNSSNLEKRTEAKIIAKVNTALKNL